MTKDKTVSFWIFNAPIWVGIAGISNFIKKRLNVHHITVATVVIYYYTWTMLTEQRRLKRRLRKELQKSKLELKLLLKDERLKHVLND